MDGWINKWNSKVKLTHTHTFSNTFAFRSLKSLLKEKEENKSNKKKRKKKGGLMVGWTKRCIINVWMDGWFRE